MKNFYNGNPPDKEVISSNLHSLKRSKFFFTLPEVILKTLILAFFKIWNATGPISLKLRSQFHDQL